MSVKGSLFIVSAPSGAGKTSLVNALVKGFPNVCVSISFTTRPRRSQEQEAVDYYFVTQEDFKAKLKEGVFLEHAQVFGQFYGTSRAWVEEMRVKGMDVILEIDWQGARQVRAQFVEALSVFILPPSREALLERLQKRHTADKVEIVNQRIMGMKDQVSHYAEYDYLLCNDQFEEALEQLKAIVQCQRLDWRRQECEKAELIKKLLGYKL
jgi:guanylate kinase